MSGPCSLVLLLVSDRFFLWSDTFQLVSVKLTKGAGQDLEAKELSVVLDGVGSSMKHIAFGREVFFGFFQFWGVGWLGIFSSQMNSILFMPLYKHSSTKTKLKVNESVLKLCFLNIKKTKPQNFDT